MKFSIAAAVVAFAASVAALPPAPDAQLAGNGVGNKGNSNVKFPVPNDVTVKQASDKCGDQAQLSCCNKATYAGDTTEVADGILAGALSNLIGAGSGAEGLGLFDQCSKLDVALLIGVQDLINQQCKQNIACCQNSGSSADGDLIGVGLPCIALGSIL
ncbi:fungal hydrophobin-domain-containing protein [Aspergillus pseudodeflectus]|uniref:Hydrophobin n=1 Tax=Aspergillus pseudodeflectus TaxID=176178 RepID=A0ABR4L6C2_9EURO